MKQEDLPPISDFSKQFGSALHEVMRAHGITQAVLAERLGRNQGYVSERLRGARAVETDMLGMVAEMTGHSPRSLVDEVLKWKPSTDELAQRRRARATPDEAPTPKAARPGRRKPSLSEDDSE